MSTGFTPSEVSTIRQWSRLWLMRQSAITLALIGLVLARAVYEL